MIFSWAFWGTRLGINRKMIQNKWILHPQPEKFTTFAISIIWSELFFHSIFSVGFRKPSEKRKNGDNLHRGRIFFSPFRNFFGWMRIIFTFSVIASLEGLAVNNNSKFSGNHVPLFQPTYFFLSSHNLGGNKSYETKEKNFFRPKLFCCNCFLMRLCGIFKLEIQIKHSKS